MPNFFNVEWLNHNSQRSYPFAEHASRRDESDSMTVPDSFLVELYLPVSTILDTQPEKFYLQSLAIIGAGFVLNIGYDDGTDAPPIIATASIPRAAFAESSRFSLVGLGAFDDTLGKVVIGRLQEIDQQPAGVYAFTPSGGALDPDTIRPMIRGVNSLSTEQSGQRGLKLRGNVVLAAGNNIRLSTILVNGEDPQIRIDAIPGDNFSDSCVCEESQAPCIRTINGIPGDSRQDFNLLGDDCLTVTAISNGLQLTDKCCKPCCGCDELNEVVRAVRGVESSSRTLESFTSRLAGRVSTMELTVLSSRLGDVPCGSGSGDVGGGGGGSGGGNGMRVDFTMLGMPGYFYLAWDGTKWLSYGPANPTLSMRITGAGKLTIVSVADPDTPLVEYTLQTSIGALMSGTCGTHSWLRDLPYAGSRWGTTASGACLP